MQAYPKTTSSFSVYFTDDPARCLEECWRSLPSADQVGRCLIFDILGSKYRLIAGGGYGGCFRLARGYPPSLEWEAGD
jgi:hypothetical protein